MARDGTTGTYSLPEAPYVYDTVISETSVNANLADIATALTFSIAKDGQTTPTASLPMGTYRHTGVGNAQARTDYAAAGQVADGALTWGGTAGGTADALTLALSPAIAAYATNMRIGFKASANANTGAATVAVNGLAAKAIQINDAALSAGQIAANKYYELYYDGTAFQLTRLSAAAGFTDPMTTRGDVIVRNSSNVTARLAVGTANQALVTDGTDVSWGAVVRPGATSTLTKGYSATPYDAGTKSSGTFTPDEANANFQYAVNGGAHTLAPPTNNCTIIIQYTNNASAGAITTSGFTKVSGSFTTTNGDDFFAYITKHNGFSFLSIQALQ